MKADHHDPLDIRIFVTVGTTRFDSLISTVLSRPFLYAISKLKLPAISDSQIRSIKLTVQYGNSSIAEIFSSSSFASVDEGSQLVPEPGLRIIDGRRVYQHKATNIDALDPGKTGTLTGLRLRTLAPQQKEQKSMKKQAETLLENIVKEAAATTGLSTTYSVSQKLSSSIMEATTSEGVELELFQLTPDLNQFISNSDIVISHAGSGTILETLRTKPDTPALIVVANTTLMGNHQTELAEALEKDGHLTVGNLESLPDQLQEALNNRANGKFKAFPDFDGSRFQSVVESVMGF